MVQDLGVEDIGFFAAFSILLGCPCGAEKNSFRSRFLFRRLCAGLSGVGILRASMRFRV